ncbi:putative zinc finger CCCH domain-containing protein 53-like [Capsicum annuum]|nr:putative zinc finger CCCH domain-containing protein 53-like [Capsicum annuum]
MDAIIKKHEVERRTGRKDRKYMMDTLLETADDENAEMKLTGNGIKGLLLNHPKTLKKLQEELDRVVGLDKLVEDFDIPNLSYLQAVVKETLRMHPSLPLAFRKCREDCVVNGYRIPKNSRLVLNVYAINRDPNEWRDADEFIPERFLVNSGENLAIEPDELEAMKRQNYCFVPFGGGRRGCPGAGLAAAVLHRTLGVLIQCFDRKIKGAEKLNMEQGAGFSSAMVHPLICYPVMRVNPLETAH